MQSYLKKKVIDVKTTIQPQYVDKDWRKNLLFNVRKKFEGKCTIDDGYIINVKRIVKITDQRIARLNGNIEFDLSIVIERVLPKIDDRMEVVIDMIFPHGVFCHHMMLRMMMPISKCGKFTMRQEFSTNSLVCKDTKKVFRKGDLVPIIINDVRFENDLYSCIVSLDVEKIEVV